MASYRRRSWRKRRAEGSNTDPVSFIDLSSLYQPVGTASWHIELDLGEGMTLRLNRR